MAASGADDPTARLFAWVESRGGSADNVVASQTRFGLGLVAARPMKKGDAAVRLPPSCLLTVSPEAASPALATLQAEVPAEFWAARLGLALLSERAKGEASFVSEYVALLPAAFTAPLFWSPEAVSLLAYPTARARLLKTAKFVASFGKEQLCGEAAAEAFGGVTVDADAFGWAITACSSRAFMVSDGARVLCPVVDLGNHAPKGEASCEVRGTAGGAIEVVALRAIAAGEEVSYCYGASLSNDDFLLDYGFVPSHNAHDECSLAWEQSGALLQSACDVAGVDGLELGGAPVPWKATALRAQLPAQLEQIRITRSGVCAHAMQACRIAAASDAAALRKCEGGQRPLPPGGEAIALRIGSAMTAIALTALPPPAQAGEGAPSPPPTDQALARAFVAGKRDVCTDSLAALAERIKAVRAGGAKAAVRGASAKQVKRGAGKRPKDKAKARPKASGFG